MDAKAAAADEVQKKPADANNLQELATLIQGVLQQTQDRFQAMSDQIIRRIDDMGKRVDELEQNIATLEKNITAGPPESF
ncbi:heat shock factor binding protein [Aphelenchoides avenae]|nr:heat shock factor binding protein [Aphelenchus avenae]